VSFAAIVLLLHQQPSAFLRLLLPGCLSASLPWCAADDIVHTQDHFCCLCCAQQHLQHSTQHTAYDGLQCCLHQRTPEDGVQDALQQLHLVGINELQAKVRQPTVGSVQDACSNASVNSAVNQVLSHAQDIQCQ
jgi:hypothetical protein